VTTPPVRYPDAVRIAPLSGMSAPLVPAGEHVTDNGAETEQLIINTFKCMKTKKAPLAMFCQVRASMILCAARDSNPEPAD
jgi:hypothetical protein